MGLPRSRQKVSEIRGRGWAVAICIELPNHGRDEGREGAATSLQKLPENGRNRGREGAAASCR